VQFWFAVPKGLVSISEVPQWAGLIEFEKRSARWLTRWDTKRAPRLHRSKCPESVQSHIRSVLYYRYHDALWKYRRQRKLSRELGAKVKRYRDQERRVSTEPIPTMKKPKNSPLPLFKGGLTG